MSEQGHSRWRFAIVPIVLSFFVLPKLLRASLPHLSPQILLVVAGGLLVTIVVVGVVTWRRERRNHA